MATLRHTRYQAAVVRENSILLVRCQFADGSAFWMFPGGGREEGEDETACVTREVVEETRIQVRVDRLLFDTPADPPDGLYTRWRTYLCSVLSGEAAPGGGEGPTATLVAVTWLPLGLEPDWPAEIRADRFLYPQLLAIADAVNS